MLAALSLALGLWSGQLVDGHVHKAPHGGLLSHCGPYLVEVVVRRQGGWMGVPGADGKKVPKVLPSVDLEVWLFTEREAVVVPAAQKVTVRAPGVPHEVALTAKGDRFDGKVPVMSTHPAVPLELDLAEGTQLDRFRITWTNLDDRERLDDSKAEGRRRPERWPQMRRNDPNR